MAQAVGAVTWVAAAVLVLAGAAKLRGPDRTMTALGVLELVVGVAVLTTGGRVPAVATAVLYLAFAGYVAWRLRERAPSCGCFGEERTPLSGVHLLVDVGAGVAAGTAAVLGASAPLSPWPTRWVPTVGVLALVLACAWLVRLLLTAVPDLRAALALHPLPEAPR